MKLQFIVHNEYRFDSFRMCKILFKSVLISVCYCKMFRAGDYFVVNTDSNRAKITNNVGPRHEPCTIND